MNDRKDSSDYLTKTLEIIEKEIVILDMCNFPSYLGFPQTKFRIYLMLC